MRYKFVLVRIYYIDIFLFSTYLFTKNWTSSRWLSFILFEQNCWKSLFSSEWKWRMQLQNKFIYIFLFMLFQKIFSLFCSWPKTECPFIEQKSIHSLHNVENKTNIDFSPRKKTIRFVCLWIAQIILKVVGEKHSLHFVIQTIFLKIWKKVDHSIFH